MSKDLFDRNQVAQIVEHVVQKIAPSSVSSHAALWEDLYKVVSQMRKELTTSDPEHIRALIPGALAELDAIKHATENAANTVMSACEDLRTRLGVAAEKEMTCIIEACTFEDLTGQRATKIRNVLETIDAHAADIATILRARFADIEAEKPKQDITKQGDASLMTGPQLPGQGLSQAEIDALLDSF